MRKTWFAGFMALALCSVVMTGVFAQPDNSAAGGDVALPVSDGYQKIAENSRFILSADTKNGYISLTDKEGVIWYSLPEGYQQDELARTSQKELWNRFCRFHMPTSSAILRILMLKQPRSTGAG